MRVFIGIFFFFEYVDDKFDYEFVGKYYKIRINIKKEICYNYQKCNFGVVEEYLYKIFEWVFGDIFKLFGKLFYIFEGYFWLEFYVCQICSYVSEEC